MLKKYLIGLKQYIIVSCFIILLSSCSKAGDIPTQYSTSKPISDNNPVIEATSTPNFTHYYKKILLSNNYNIILKDLDDKSFKIELYCNDSLVKAEVFGNALSNDELIKKINLISKSSFEYFITLYDISSTYGSQHNVIVWHENKYDSWNFIETPFERGFAEDVNKDGIYEVVSYLSSKEIKELRRVYTFSDGLLEERKGLE